VKVVFALRHSGHFRFFDDVIRELCGVGHTVQALLDPHHTSNTEAKGSMRALMACQQETPGFSWDWALARRDAWRRPLFLSRELISYSGYLQPGRQGSQAISSRYLKVLPPLVQWALRRPAARRWLLRPATQSALRRLERRAPPDRAILGWLREHRPDVVVASPYIMARSEEVEYVKAALKLGIPSIAAITSWDHLTTKGMFQIVPDLTLVWNQNQVEEAVTFHGLPRERIAITGAPVFDRFFTLRPSLDRAEFCQQAGLDPARPYLLYLCSSKSIARQEADFVVEFARGLRQSAGLQQTSLLVRPHPLNADIWQDYPRDLLTVWPPRGDVPETSQSRQDYFHSLFYSEAVMGINTSAFIDAAIVDKPCLAVLAERFRDTQLAIAHFRHLLNANFLHTVPDAAGAARALQAILAGDDALRDNRRRFVRNFVRPWGLDQPASRVMARAIEAAARRVPSESLSAVLAGEREVAATPALEPAA
jgi:hypothetical protein